MNSEQQSIGMMEGAFFVPKTDLINWVNTFLDLNISKIQQLGTGAVYCNIIDAMFPGKVAMQRVNWKARNQWEFINNYKILQQAFAKCKIQKYIDIEKLSKSKYQDNLEFIQWLKRYYDLHNKNNVPYDAKQSRKNAEVDFSFVEIRNPLKRQKESTENLRKAKSPYDKVRSKINNNRSLTVAKSKNENSQYLKQKLFKIKNILSKQTQQKDKLNRIQQIMEEIEEELPQELKNESEISLVKNQEQAKSKKLIQPIKKEKQNKKK